MADNARRSGALHRTCFERSFRVRNAYFVGRDIFYSTNNCGLYADHVLRRHIAGISIGFGPHLRQINGGGGRPHKQNVGENNRLYKLPVCMLNFEIPDGDLNF